MKAKNIYLTDTHCHAADGLHFKVVLTLFKPAALRGRKKTTKKSLKRR